MQVSIFTIALRDCIQLHSKAFVADSTDHSKEVIVAYIYKLLAYLPKSVKTVKIWSDGPTAQFKNKYISAAIQLFENLFPFTIVWNFFATSHGKGCVDGIGAAVKAKVRRLVLSRQAIVHCAKDFVNAFNLNESSIDVVEVTQSEIDKINADLELEFVFITAKSVKNISKCHQLQIQNNDVVGFTTSKEGYEFLAQKVESIRL